MMKTFLKNLLNTFGYEIRKQRPDLLGVDPFQDVARLRTSSTAPVIFDVGANNGQTVLKLKSYWPDARIHCFEPGSVAFKELSHRYDTDPLVTMNNLALGTEKTKTTFHECAHHDLNSLLKPRGLGYETTEIEVNSLADYCMEHGIESADLLKIDTQGYELEVLSGAESLLRAGKIQFVFTEILFNELYENAPTLSEIYDFLSSMNLHLVSFYRPSFRNDKLSCTDALFQSRHYQKNAS